MEKTALILGLVILIVAPIVLIVKNLYEFIIKPVYERIKERIISLIPRWIRGK